jgi:ABC-2 type transport system permease protein
MTIAPKWLQDVSDVNPLKHIVEAVRALFRGDLWVSTVIWGLGLTLGLVLVGMWYGTSTFRRESS